jgi:hypothetical protein
MTRFASTTAALALAALLGTAAPALAQSDAAAVAQSAVGSWLYDANGDRAGSVYGVTDGGRTVIIQWGTYFTPGRKLVEVPATDLAIRDGHVTLRTLTAEAVRGLPAID